MDIMIATAAALPLMGASVLLHFQAMVLTRRGLSASAMARHTGTLLGMGAMAAAQLLSVTTYAAAYLILERWLGIGQLAGELEGGFIDQFYFSLMSFTTLGVGDIHPLGAFRIISGIEALNGFALIGWTASFGYSLMRDGWE
jgi:hypothetical protein|tara:strand:- start:66 stop:491 length:426 start_codon:yes stop_codon:yes gene_type:complete